MGGTQGPRQLLLTGPFSCYGREGRMDRKRAEQNENDPDKTGF
jgi:hypothetical protein